MAHIHACPEHDDCTAITEGDFPAEAGSWRSHHSADVAAETRLNLDYPDATHEDGKKRHWRMPTRSEAAVLGLDDDQHRRLAAAAVVRIEDAKHPLKGIAADVAKAAGFTLADARKHAADHGLTTTR